MRISNQLRKAMAVATAVAEEVKNNMAEGKAFLAPNFGARPVLMEFGPLKKDPNSVRFFFEGGVEVFAHMANLTDFQESWRRETTEYWVVTYVTVLYYENPKSPTKIAEEWDKCELDLLRKLRPWYQPSVTGIEGIKGTVGIFWDNASWEGAIETDPDRDQAGFMTQIKAVSYRRLVPGDLERARKKARKILSGIYKGEKKEEEE